MYRRIAIYPVMRWWDGGAIDINWAILLSLLEQFGSKVSYITYRSWNGISFLFLTPASSLVEGWIVWFCGLASPWWQDEFCSCFWKMVTLASTLIQPTRLVGIQYLDGCSGTLAGSFLMTMEWGINIGYHDYAFQTGTTSTNSSTLWLNMWVRTQPTKFQGGLVSLEC